MATKYRICRRYTPEAGTWYVVQKKRLFGWHTYNISFREVSMAQQFIDNIDYALLFATMVETPLVYNKRARKFIEKCPYLSYNVKVK